MQQKLLQVADVAAIVGVTSSAVHTAVVAGRLRVAFRTPRGMRFFSGADVERYRVAHEERAARRRRRETT